MIDFIAPDQTPLGNEDITKVMDSSLGSLTDSFCRELVFYMQGMLRNGGNLDFARQCFFQQIKLELQRREK